MKRRLISILLCAVLLTALGGSIPAAAAYDGINYDRITADMVNYFKGKEGDYGSVNAYDGNACSIGILQWHGARALGLLKRVAALNASDAKRILGTSLYNEIVNSAESAWKTRTLSGSEASRVSEVLDTAYGHQAQDKLAHEDISGYCDHGYRLGIRTDPALEYFCDIENQYGAGGCENVVKRAKEWLGVTTITSLDRFHRALAGYGHPYMTRRNSTYNYIKSLGYDTTGALITLPDEDTDPDDECVGCPGGHFTDMPGKSDWAHGGIEYAIAAGLLCGTSATTFSPDMTMSRAMTVQLLYNFDCRSVEMAGTDAPRGTFTDVPAGRWYEKAVLWAAGRDIVSGVGDGRFDPDAAVTREQIAAMLYRYAQAKGCDTGGRAALTGFPDAESISAFACAPLQWAVAVGLISGETNNGVTTLDPQGVATRAQAACIAMRFDKSIVRAG